MDWSAAALMMAALGGGDGLEPGPISPIQLAQVTIRRELVVRVPVRVRPAAAAAVKQSRIEWKEKRGPKCIAARSIVAATAMTQKSVDLLLRDRTRLRARFERSCPALEYYAGFYVSPNPDGLICADRDAVRSRVGGECGIDRFRALRASVRD